MTTYRIADENNTVKCNIETLADAKEYAEIYECDVFDEESGECVWVNPELEIS